MLLNAYTAARLRRGNFAGALQAARPRALACSGSLLMLAALGIRLASGMPGVPALHWHGATARIHAGGGLPHTYGLADGRATGAPADREKSACGSYFSPSAIPVEVGDSAGADLVREPQRGGYCRLAKAAPRGVAHGEKQTRAPPDYRQFPMPIESNC